MPLSVLDLVPIGSGSTATAALAHSTTLVRRAEELGWSSPSWLSAWRR